MAHKVLFLVAFLILHNFFYAQTKTDSVSNVEEIVKDKNVFIKRNFMKKGIFPEFEISVINCNNLKTNVTTTGLAIILKDKHGMVLYEDAFKTAYLDKEELKELIVFFETITPVLQTTPENYTQFIYRNKTNFKASCTWLPKENFKGGEWELYFHLYENKSLIKISKKDLTILMEILKKW